MEAKLVHPEEERTIGEISTYSEDLIARLALLEIDEIVTYEELSEVIGFDVTLPKGRNYLSTARNYLLKEQKVFGTVRCEGIKRLSDSEIVKTTGKGYVKSVRKKSKIALMKNSSVDYFALSDELKIEQNKTRTILELLNQVTKRSSIKLIENQIKKTKLHIDQKETLKLLRKPLMDGDE